MLTMANHNPVVVSDGKDMLFNMGGYKFALMDTGIISLNTCYEREFHRTSDLSGNVMCMPRVQPARVSLELFGGISQSPSIMPTRNIYEMSIIEIMEEVNRRIAG